MLRCREMPNQKKDTSLAKARKTLFSKLARRVGSGDVVRAMERVPREYFVPVALRSMAYQDTPLAIGRGQTISQPYIVALMTEALQLQPRDRVLEVGTGSGYQAAILAELVPSGQVTTVELLPELAESARRTLDELGYTTVASRPAGDTPGYQEGGPYDAIIVTAAVPGLPSSLLSQLAIGGRLVAPVGSLDQQQLVQAHRTGEGISPRLLGPCRFVPLLGPEGFSGESL